MKHLPTTFRAFKYRNFRLFFPGLLVSQIGIWLQNVAVGWLVYDITKSPLSMGTIMFFNAIPLFMVTPFAGVIVDKFDRHKLLLTVQLLYALQALLMTLLTFSGLIAVWNIILLGMFLNSVAAIDGPLRQSTFIYLVDNKDDLTNAISLNSACFNSARLIGPALAGLLIAYIGVKMCFLLNFLCLAPMFFLVKMMQIPKIENPHVKNETLLEGLTEGIHYAASELKVVLLLSWLASLCFLIMIYPMLMPIYTAEVLKLNADTLGFLLGAAGLGSLCSSLILASKTSLKGLKSILFGGTLLCCACFVGLGLVSSKFPALILMFGIGLGSAACFTPENMLLQSVIEDDKRGRIMSLNSLCFMGTTSLSSLFAGTIAETFGIAHTLIILGMILCAIAIVLHAKLEPQTFPEHIHG